MSVQDAESLQDRVAIGVWFADSRANYPVNDHADRGISVHLRVCGSWVTGSDDWDWGVDEWMYGGRPPSQPQGSLDGDAFNRTVDSPNGMIHSVFDCLSGLDTKPQHLPLRLIAKDPDLRDHHDPSIQALVETNFFGLNRALLTLLLAGGLEKHSRYSRCQPSFSLEMAIWGSPISDEPIDFGSILDLFIFVLGPDDLLG